DRRGLVELEAELAVADQLAVGRALRRVGLDADDTVLHLQLARRHAEPRRGHVDQRLPGGGRGLADLHAADLHGQTAPGRSLDGGQRGVARDWLAPPYG